MKRSIELKQQRKQKLDAQKVLLEERKATDKKEFTEDQTRSFNTLNDEITDFDKRIAQAEKEEEAEARIAGLSGEVVDTGEEKEMAEMKKRYSFHKAIRSQTQNGEPLSGVEKEMHEEAQAQARSAGVAISGIAIPVGGQKRADGQTVTQDSGNFGGALVDTDQREIIDLLRPRPILQDMGARFLTGLQGNVKFPVNQGGISATWEGEVTKVANSKNQYGSKTMTPHRLAVSVPISLQNLMQSSIDLEQYTIADIRNEIANEIDKAGINGSGASNQPEGIINNSDVNVISIGTNGGAITWPLIVDMETQVYIQNANSAQMGYIVTPATKGKLKTTKHTAGDLNYLMSMAGEINGYNVGVSNLVPGNITKGTGINLNAAVYGDFSQLLIGQWGFMDVSVDEFSRKREGYIEITVNTFVDVLVKQPKAFSVIKDIDLTA